jgi:hypothetical protein
MSHKMRLSLCPYGFSNLFDYFATVNYVALSQIYLLCVQGFLICAVYFPKLAHINLRAVEIMKLKFIFILLTGYKKTF